MSNNSLVPQFPAFPAYPTAQLEGVYQRRKHSCLLGRHAGVLDDLNDSDSDTIDNKDYRVYPGWSDCWKPSMDRESDTSVNLQKRSSEIQPVLRDFHCVF